MVDSPYYRPPDDDATAAPDAAARPAPKQPAWVVVATTSSRSVASELLERFAANEIVGRSRQTEGDDGPEFEVQVPPAEEDRAAAFIEDDGYDLLEYQGFAWHDRQPAEDDAAGGLTTVALIFGVLLVVCVLLLIAA